MTNYELIKSHDENTILCSFQQHMRESSATYKEIISKGHQYSLVESGISIIEGGYSGNDSNTTQELEEKELFLNLGNF